MGARAFDHFGDCCDERSAWRPVVRIGGAGPPFRTCRIIRIISLSIEPISVSVLSGSFNIIRLVACRWFDVHREPAPNEAHRRRSLSLPAERPTNMPILDADLVITRFSCCRADRDAVLPLFIARASGVPILNVSPAIQKNIANDHQRGGSRFPNGSRAARERKAPEYVLPTGTTSPFLNLRRVRCSDLMTSQIAS